jgi:hypothetical protein
MLRRPNVILIIFIGFKILQTIGAFQAGRERIYLAQILFVETLICTFMAVQAIRGKKFALWIMGLYLLVHFGAIIVGLLIPFNQYILKTMAIAFGIYFTFGGIILIQKARQLKDIGPEPQEHANRQG